MARKRGKNSSSRREEVEDLVELVGALSNIRNGGNGHDKPDPSVNVKREVELRAEFEKERRDSDKDWQKRLDTERQRADVASAEAERSRIDAKFGDVVQNALLTAQAAEARAATLATTLATATETLRKSQETTDLATRAAIRAVEQNQATGGGEKLAQTAQRTQGNWNVGQWLYVGGVAVLIAVDLKTRGFI